MSEFANRIDTQRNLLKIVNTVQWPSEPLLSLSLHAIQRFAKSNQLAEEAELLVLLKKISGKLFFLANKSQEQVTEEYRMLSSEVSAILFEITASIKKMSE